MVFILGPCFVMLYIVSFLAIILQRKRELVCFSLIVFLLSGGCQRSVSLPRGVVCWSVVCDCGISWAYSLVFGPTYGLSLCLLAYVYVSSGA